VNRKTIVLQQKPLKHQTKFSLVATVSKVAIAAAASASATAAAEILFQLVNGVKGNTAETDSLATTATATDAITDAIATAPARAVAAVAATAAVTKEVFQGVSMDSLKLG
jgi:hypothetical protein